VWHYNNAGFVLAGHVLETLYGKPYEDAVRELVPAPLGLDHTFFYSDAVIGYNVAASHTIDGGRPTVQPAYWAMPRTLHPTGGLVSSARDQLRYARFHLGEGGATGGQPVLSPASIRAMRADLTPPGTMGSELNGIGVAWWMRSSPERVPICQINGDWIGQHAGMLVVPDRAFAVVVLTNGDGGEIVVAEVCAFDDGALRQFLGLNNPPDVPRMRTAAELAPYEGRYLAMAIDPPPGDVPETWVEIGVSEGKLRATRTAGDQRQEFDVAFYRDNFVVLLDPQGQPSRSRADFGPGPDGRIMWFRLGGRLHMRQA
jgi:CubicO group peptidase (beta-lactamase class C family)